MCRAVNSPWLANGKEAAFTSGANTYGVKRQLCVCYRTVKVLYYYLTIPLALSLVCVQSKTTCQHHYTLQDLECFCYSVTHLAEIISML